MLLFAGTAMLIYVPVAWRRHDISLALPFAALGLMVVAAALTA